MVPKLFFTIQDECIEANEEKAHAWAKMATEKCPTFLVFIGSLYTAPFYFKNKYFKKWDPGSAGIESGISENVSRFPEELLRISENEGSKLIKQ